MKDELPNNTSSESKAHFAQRCPGAGRFNLVGSGLPQKTAALSWVCEIICINIVDTSTKVLYRTEIKSAIGLSCESS